MNLGILIIQLFVMEENILRFKTLSENGIKHKNVVQIHKIE